MSYISARHLKNLAPVRSKLELLAPSRSFVNLPEELVTMVMMELDIEALTKLRVTCRTMDRISRGSQIWRNLFVRNLGVTIPRPFFLSKPLKECSAGDIESDLRRWEIGWGPRTRRPNIIKREVDTPGDLKRYAVSLPAVCLLPGGRWLIAAFEDGSVWSFDLSQQETSPANLERKLLIPSPYKGTQHDGSRIQVRLSIDFTSSEALGESSRTHHLEQFNLAVIACPKVWKTAVTHVDVWQVHIPYGDGQESEMRLGDHLSSFTEIGTSALEDCSLLGPALAYSLGTAPARCVVIVNWSEANGKSKDAIQRRYLPHLALNKIVLIPGERLFAVHGDRTVYVYDWAKDFQASALPPQEQQCPRVSDPWRESSPMRNVLGMSTPMVINNTVRVIVPCTRFISGYSIPISGDIKKTTSTYLKKAQFGYNRVQAYGYHRGVGFSDFSNLTSSEYRWPGETVVAETRPVACLHHPVERLEKYDGGRMLFDQYSNRAVVTDFYASRLFFISFTD
ncbi:hypothetical protein BKA70DRAFT_1559498 [Coprinopsis sp. MPI-PUGE-AT-0042]|nr:hypothetical protein BKA70DRAFT_1559498 [Coprinopsis sp. MPI-PUGE-AT-0042]